MTSTRICGSRPENHEPHKGGWPPSHPRAHLSFAYVVTWYALIWDTRFE